ncbi:hypothetical protein BDV25DRAFT_130909 [Aspergillus avenaceus]|uniref:SnoaL-like domain-containing protein n=1 Tax=Aspergillus avenaceus TaxID=36643 RepID=A0A5N6TR57_ASPAV|nr:hypothetical protein BDV25DRAFT_130909 [Aspergillus avenaceus]
MKSYREALLQRTHSLTSAFSNPSTPLSDLLSNFTTDPVPTAHEHGLAELAPFLGREFKGHEGLKQYFGLLDEYLVIERMEFEDSHRWGVDVELGVVVLRGSARFRAKETGKGWDETFVYRVELVDLDGGEVKVCRYEVWADTGALYLARCV